MEDLPPKLTEPQEVPDRTMPLPETGPVQRTMDKHTRTGDPCDRCGRSVLTGEQVFICRGARIVCELCIGFESEAPLETRLVHGAELGSTIRIVDKRSRPAPAPVPPASPPRRRRRAQIVPPTEPPE